MAEPSSSSDNLRDLAAKQEEWRHLAPEVKLDYLQQIMDTIKNDVGHGGFLKMANKNLEMMGMPSDTPEGQAQAAETAFFSCMCIKQTLFGLQQAYEVRTGQSKVKNKLTNLYTKKAINGQVVAQILPGDPASKFNPFAKNNSGEIWFDAKHVKKSEDVKPFSFDFLDKKTDGICVVLGAGNWDFLSVNDCLHALFVLNQVVFLKHHVLRGESLDPLVRQILAPLLNKGFFQSEVDKGVERSSEIVYSPHVSTVHITGGKPAHDAIVWGSTPEEQAKRKHDKNPKLKADMSAELGAVSPWLVPPVEYTGEELDHLAQSIASAVFNNSSCNCNAPKVIVMSKTWTQGGELKEKTLDCFSQFETPCSYYPGSKERWEAAKENMGNTKVVESKKKLSVEERKLTTPKLGKDGPVALSLLTMDVDVDMSTVKGRQEAMDQYAFQHEPFAPTLCFASMVDNGTVDDFLEKSVEFANDCLFGTLSCSLTVPPSLDGCDAVEKTIANLEYGQVVLNAWAAVGFVTGLPWGGFPPKEMNLEAVQTGHTKLFNSYFLPHVEKAVIRTPMIADNHVIKPVEFPDPKGNIDALKFFVSASVDPAKEVSVPVTLNTKESKKLSKLEAKLLYHMNKGHGDEVQKIRDEIGKVWEDARAHVTHRLDL